MKQWIVFENVRITCTCIECEEVYNNKPVYVDVNDAEYRASNSDLVVGLLRDRHKYRPATDKEILLSKLGAK